MKPQVLLLLGIIAVIFVAGCTSQTGQITGDYFGNPKNETETVLTNFLRYMESANLEEAIYNLEKQSQYADKEFKDYLLSLKNLEESYLMILNDFDENCLELANEEVCDYLISERDKGLDNYFYSEVEIKDKSFLDKNNHIIWKVDGSLKTNFDYSVGTVSYIFERINDEWKIIDMIDSENISVSQTKEQIEEEFTEIIRETEEYVDRLLSFAIEAKDDGCWAIEINEKLTYTEQQEELNICYQGKYITPAVQKKDRSYCDKIINSAFAGQCYGYVAVAENSYSLCGLVEDKEYEAKGYEEKLSERDLCYFIYSSLNYENVCNKIGNEQFKTECNELFK